MSAKSTPNIIPVEELNEYQTWHLPSLDGSENLLSSAAKQARERAAKEQEIIEEVDASSVDFAPMTADELQAITDAAEQEGFAKGKAEGFDAGRPDGFNKGYQDGLKKAEIESAAKLSQQVAQLQQVVDQLADPLAEQQTQLERLILDYVCALTKQVVGRELQLDSSHIVNVLEKSLALLPVGSDTVMLTVNPDDLALVELYAEKKHKNWKFISDENMLPGGCKLETPESLVDFSVETKMESLFEQFMSGELMDENAEQMGLEPEVIETESDDLEVEAEDIEVENEAQVPPSVESFSSEQMSNPDVDSDGELEP